MMSWMALVAIVAVFVGIDAEDCDVMEFHKCVGQIREFADGYAFHVTSSSQLMESCETKLSAVKCTNEFVSRCMDRSEKEVFKVTTGGKMKLVEELCTEGTDLNKGYVENFKCWKMIANDTLFCNEQFEKSQHILVQEDLIERLRMFHSCCAFDWHKMCKTKAAEAKCNTESRDFVDSVTTLLGGRVLSQLCGASFTNCHGLYGVDVEDLDTRYSRMSGGGGAMATHTAAILSYLLSIAIVLCF